MNRQQLREIKSLPIREFEAAVNAVVYDEIEKARSHAYNTAWSSMFLALVNRYPWMNVEILHSIAVDTVDIANGVEPASELRAQLLERTGFDVFEPPHQSDIPYIEIEKGAIVQE